MSSFIGKHSITLCDGRTYVYEIASYTQHFYGAYLISGVIPARFTIFQEDMSHYHIDFRVRGIGDVKIDTDTRNGITPICNFEPGDIGVIAEVAVPCVWTINGKSREFACVDYWKDGFKWRTSLFIKQMRKVK